MFWLLAVYALGVVGTALFLWNEGPSHALGCSLLWPVIVVFILIALVFG